jgi:DNA-binding CsgD family transcriptional regulator
VDLFPGPERVECLLRTGQEEAARQCARDYLAQAEAKGQSWARARAERAVAMVSEAGEAERRFSTALELHRLNPDTFEEARTRLAFGATLRRDRRRVAARPLLRAAVAAFEQVGAEPWAVLAAQELVATGESANRRGDSPLSRLTGQELQISRMLASGRTTRETAAALFLSPKTVEYHLRHVYTKLDIHSRAELSEALAEGVPGAGGPG